jgi:hypothetical protein
MLDRRKFLKIVGITAAGAAVSMGSPSSLFAERSAPEARVAELPPMYLRGHKRSGCAFRPEMTDIWAGGGGMLPEDF